MKSSISEHNNRHSRHFLALLLIAFLSVPMMQAQKIKVGLKGGLSSTSVKPNDLIILNGADFEELSLAFQESTPEYHGGLFARVSLLGFYVQPEVLIATAKTKYLVGDLSSGSSSVVKERYYNLEVPIMAGVKLGPFRAQGGPVYRMNLNNNSDWDEISGVVRNWQDSSLGLRAGVGLDLGKKIIFDLNYEFNLTNNRDEITIFGQTHEVSQRGSQLVASLGYTF